MCITVLYQIVGRSFNNHLSVLEAKVSEYNERYQKKNKTKTNANVFGTFNVLKSSFFEQFIENPDEIVVAYQKSYGYTVFAKLLILLATKKLDGATCLSKEDHKKVPKSNAKPEKSKPAKAIKTKALSREKKDGKKSFSSFTQSEFKPEKHPEKSSPLESNADLVPPFKKNPVGGNDHPDQNLVQFIQGQLNQMTEQVCVLMFFQSLL
jgi:hypothetical protein